MPVIETDFATATSRDKELLDLLVSELRVPREAGQPTIEIRQMSRDGLRHVHVIWDRWEDVPPERRAALIRDAFTEVKGPGYEKTIAITLAATVSEAEEAGLLPYGVEPYGEFDLTARAEVRHALLAEGASDQGRNWLPSLSYAGMGQARAAVDRLKTAFPQYEWNIVITRVMEG